MFGLQEENEEKEDGLVDAVEATFEETGVVPFPVIHSAYRLGEIKPGKARPVKVLSAASNLTRSLTDYFHNVVPSILMN